MDIEQSIKLDENTSTSQVLDMMNNPQNYQNKTEPLKQEPPAPVNDGVVNDGSANPPAQEPAAPSAPSSETNWLEISDGKFDSKEEMSRFLTQAETHKKERDDLEKQYKEAQEKIASVVNPFASDEVFKFNELVKNGTDKNIAMRIASSDLSTMSPIDALILKELAEDPSLVGDEGLLRRKFERKYGVNANEEDLTPEEKETLEDLRFDLKRDSKKAADELLKIRDSITVPTVDIEALAKQREEAAAQLKDGWEKVVPELLKGRTAIPLNVLSANKESKHFMDFVLDDELLKNRDKQLVEFAVQNRIPLTEDGLKTLAEAFDANFYLENKERIYHSIMTKAREMSNEEWRTYTENPSALKNRDVKSKDVTTQEEHNASEMARMKQELGLR
jgi:hypothetical protein